MATQRPHSAPRLRFEPTPPRPSSVPSCPGSSPPRSGELRVSLDEPPRYIAFTPGGDVILSRWCAAEMLAVEFTRDRVVAGKALPLEERQTLLRVNAASRHRASMVRCDAMGAYLVFGAPAVRVRRILLTSGDQAAPEILSLELLVGAQCAQDEAEPDPASVIRAYIVESGAPNLTAARDASRRDAAQVPDLEFVV